jgi:hypothetical protein
MRIACLILAHKNPGQLERLLRVMDHPAFDFYIHVDGKADQGPFEYLRGRDRVFFIRDRVKVGWGQYSLVQATLNGLEGVLAGGAYGYIHVMSAQDFPIKPMAYIYQYLRDREGKEYITCLREGDGHEWWKVAALHAWQYNFHNWAIPGKYRLQAVANFLLPRRKYPVAGHEVVGHSQWFTITAGSARYLLAYLKDHPRVVRFFRYVWGADELIFSTVIYNNPAYRDRIEDNVFYIDWSRGGASPKLLTGEDLPALLDSDKLFARKFDAEVDSGVLDALERGL